MKRFILKHRQKIALAALALAPLPFMQNCSAYGTNFDSNTGSTTASLSSLSISSASSSITATYSPSSPQVGYQVALSGQGGTAPYTYTLMTTNGSISGSVFTATASGAVKILVMDSKSGYYQLSFTVADSSSSGGSGSGSGGTTTTATPVPSTTSSVTMPDGVVFPRSCTVNTSEQVVNNHNIDIAGGINYEFCMILGRAPNNTELLYWLDGIKNGDLQAQSLPTTLFQSAEFGQRYAMQNMTNAQMALFVPRLLAYREPYAFETTNLLNAAGSSTGSNAESAMINQFTNSDYFHDANPFLVQLQNAYSN